MIQTLADMKVTYTDPIPIHCDNTSAISVSKNPVLHSKTKNIPIKYHFLREQVTNRIVQLNYIPSTEQIVDIFTKPLAVGKYLTDSEWKIFNRQRMLVIDGKYRSNDGLSTTVMINRKIEDKSRKIE
jgi:hypothetical protein